jgi:16S rRNA (guanine1516-N2)-methyltransferase
VVIERGRVSLWDRQGPLRFHEGMAALRIKRIDAGETDDTFVRVAELRAGDQLLDCTLGLAQDALVAARVVGPEGRVVGVEKSRPLALIASEGLAGIGSRIEVVHGDALEHLRRLPSKSFDIVYFDPMFEKPRKAQPSFEVLRRHADHSPVTPEHLEEAKRVARRSVVVKGAKYSQDLRKLGLTALALSRFSDVAWARIDLAG